MDLVSCPRCHEEINRNANYCPRCGISLTKTPREISHPIQASYGKKSPKHKILAYVISITCIAAILAIAIASYNSQKYSELPTENTQNLNYLTAKPKEYNVIYKVTGFGDSYSVTYNDEQGNTCQLSSVSHGWYYFFKAREGHFLYISAQNNSDYGNVTVQILVETGELKRATSSGGYTIATASAILPSEY